MKEFFTKLIATKEARANELRSFIEKCEDVNEARKAYAELESVNGELTEARGKLAEIEAEEARKAQPPVGAAFNPVATYTQRKDGTATDGNAALEARAKAFAESGKMTIDNAEARAVLVSSGTLVTPTKVSGINGAIGAKVSSIVDLVKVVDASGMGAYKVAYQKTDSTATTQIEGGEHGESNPTFDSVEITPQTESIVSYISKQARKQTPLNYTQKVNSSALLALRKRAAKIITDKLVASTLNVALPLTAIDATSLRKIAMNYGGDESIVGGATLFLTKADLVKFGDVRGQNEKKAVYEITPDASNPNTGIIKDGGLSVQYCIDSNLAEGKLVYGQPHCFELALFSNYEIAVSEDYAITKGLLTIVGDVELGGDVTVPNGFVVATVA
jgi:HK97 family phage major capsid protein